ncbi:hypothetical protein AADG42_16470 [Ammonicoccus fulvus]|uniref:Uncharacterized protein n=1 Tax=Ammonicoccus fulvus TaxID=3138240 RepID=A0ABZ3FRY0_9ACTN
MTVAGWQTRAFGHLGQIADFFLPPFQMGTRRLVRRTTSGRVGPALPFQAFTYVVDDVEIEVASLPLPFPLPPLVVHRGPSVRAGVLTPVGDVGDLARVTGVGERDAFEVACGQPEFARAVLQPAIAQSLRSWGSPFSGSTRDGLLPNFDIALDGAHLVAVNGPTPDDPRFPTYLTRLLGLTLALVNAPIRHFVRPPRPPGLGFRGRLWAWEPNIPGIAFRYRSFAGLGEHNRIGQAIGVVRGRVADLPFTALGCPDPDFAVLVVHTGMRLPPLWIGGQDGAGRTGVPDFDRRWRLHCPDPRFAADLLPTESLQRLAATDRELLPTLRVQGGELGVRLRRWSEADIADAVDLLEDLLAGAAWELRRALGVRTSGR